jgi:hypothetical protein
MQEKWGMQMMKCLQMYANEMKEPLGIGPCCCNAPFVWLNKKDPKHSTNSTHKVFKMYGT